MQKRKQRSQKLAFEVLKKHKQIILCINIF